ncbi:EamA family transporter [Paenibacillus sp. YIM B09110]|uniref:EamA family transporter n=1 Tax=Paenibacillus sp. YIM B09110 TaxID=3126102 RepID=UPI003FA6F0AB
MGSEDFTEWSAFRYATITCVFGSLISLVLCSLLTTADLIPAVRFSEVTPVISNLAFLVVFGGVIALFTWFKGISILKPANGILFVNFVPITALAISMFQGYHVSSPEIVGISFVVIGLIMNNVFERKLKEASV